METRKMEKQLENLKAKILAVDSKADMSNIELIDFRYISLNIKSKKMLDIIEEILFFDSENSLHNQFSFKIVNYSQYGAKTLTHHHIEVTF